jgi:hypothetical protein
MNESNKSALPGFPWKGKFTTKKEIDQYFSNPAYSGDLGRANRRKSAACSGASRPPKPEQNGHRSERSDAGFKYFSNF